MLPRTLIILVAAAALGSPALARGPSPYLPLELEPEIERQIEQVLILAGVPHLTRPIPAALVLEALPRACRIDELLCERVEGYLQSYQRKWALLHASAGAAVPSGEHRAVPNRHGLGSGSAWEVSARAQWQPFDHAIVSGGAVAYDGEITPTGTLLSAGWSKFQIDLGWRDHWFSPFTDSAMQLSTEAATMPSLTLSNYEPLTRLGFRYLVFGALQSESDTIVHEGEPTSGRPRLSGVHLSIEPVAGWSFGATRVMQYGGGDRDSSFDDFLKAFFNPAKYDNVGPGETSDEQFGNQLGGFTTRFVFPGPVPFAAYLEYAGEDTLAGENFMLGNASLSLGIDFPRLFERFDFTYELSEWQNGWYVHPLYGDGLTNEGRIVGHWGADQREFNDGVGAQTHMIRLGWRPHFGGVFELRYRTIDNESYSPPSYVRGHDVTARYARPWRNLSLGGEVYAGRDVKGKGFSRVMAFVRYAPSPEPAEPEPASPSRSDDDEERPSGAEIFVDSGISASMVHIDLDRSIPETNTDWAPALHIGLGARRAVTKRQDLGLRLELDEVDDDWMISARFIDYRFRIWRHFALSAFFGAARWDLETPAYGIYLGGGVQWRNLLPGWDLNFDARYAPNIARDDLVPTDPIGDRISSFREVVGVAFYLSRNF